MRDVEKLRSRPPSEKTIERDVACLLQSYARVIPTEDKDPEDALECPFVELGLLSYFRTSGYYQVHQGEKEIPTHLLGYALSMAFEEVEDRTRYIRYIRERGSNAAKEVQAGHL